MSRPTPIDLKKLFEATSRLKEVVERAAAERKIQEEQLDKSQQEMKNALAEMRRESLRAQGALTPRQWQDFVVKMIDKHNIADEHKTSLREIAQESLSGQPSSVDLVDAVLDKMDALAQDPAAAKTAGADVRQRRGEKVAGVMKNGAAAAIRPLRKIVFKKAA